MKPAARYPRARPQQTLLTALTKGASVIALCTAGFLGQAIAKSLPVSANLELHQTQKLEINNGVSKPSSSRFNQILQDVQKPRVMLEQAALSWPPQFAIGQTWTVNFVGIGTWNLPLTETIEGDATGFTTGTDRREGYFKYFPKNGNDPEIAISFLQSATDVYECIFSPAGNPSGNTLKGDAYRYILATKKSEDLKTTCSATLVSGSSQTTNPTSPFANPNVPLNPNTNTAQGSAPVWPPKPGEAWTMTIDGLAPWAINFEKLDKDGDPTGTAIQSGIKSTAFAYLDNGEYIFEVTDGKIVTECVFTKLQVQGNAFIGGKAYSGDANSNSIPSLNKACSAAIGSGAVQQAPQAQNLSWPPQLAVGQNWDYRFGTRPVVYHGNFTSVTSNIYKGDLITEGSSDPIAKRALSVIYSAKDDALISLAEDPQGGMTGCLFIGKDSIKNNTYTGSTSYRAPGAKDFVDQNLECRMNAVTAAPQTPAATLVPTWPPKTGETWTMTIDGLAPWQINFDKLDKDGNPSGTATQSGAKFLALAFKDSDGYEFGLVDDINIYFCTFSTLKVQGNAFVGGEAYAGPKNANSIPSLKKSCSAAIGSSASANTNTSSSTLGGIFGNATTNTNANAGLGWPVQVAVGQVWSVSVKNIVFQLKLERVNNGITIGTATASNVELAGGFATQGDNLNLILTDGTATILCTFGRSSVQGQTLNGQATYTEKPNAAEQSWGACNATLAPKVSGIGEPLNVKRNNILEAQVSMLRQSSGW